MTEENIYGVAPKVTLIKSKPLPNYK